MIEISQNAPGLLAYSLRRRNRKKRKNTGCLVRALR
jgi:hypothetical protein